jgi:phenylpropionate dioxygenase-like ring-hydroxylating dioxygenase large terminal subunit
MPMRVNTVLKRFPFPSYPAGWFCVGFSNELRKSDVRSLRYFGQDLICFRTQSGIAVVMDAHCPHLGAHLGYGGKVQGEQIQCPFHGWKFDKEGKCTFVPHAKRTPDKATLKSWICKEINGVILVYYPSNAPATPKWEIPDLTGSLGGATFQSVKQWKIRSHPQETGENAEDITHFLFLHGQHTKKIASISTQSRAHIFEHMTSYQFGSVIPFILQSLAVSGTVTYTHYGLGLLMARIQIPKILSATLEVQVCFYSTPIDEDFIHYTVLMACTSSLGPILTKIIKKIVSQAARKTTNQDLPIWTNKIYRSKPMLSDADGPIMKYRNWARQFYMKKEI